MSYLTKYGSTHSPFVRLIIAVIGLLVNLTLMTPSIGSAQLSALPETAPLSRDFLLFQKLAEAGAGRQGTIQENYGLGLIPSPLDLSHLHHEAIQGALDLLGYPVSYDLRTQGKLTPIRNQGSCGSCWSFATFGSLESNLMPSEAQNFSENNLKNTHGFDPAACSGGNADMSMAYLARWGGVISETDDPYNASSGISPLGLKPVKHIQEVLIIANRTSSLDNNNLKQSVMTYGGIYTTMYWSDSYYHSGNRAYYYSGSPSANHAVTIVGWDDNYPRGRFSTAPPGDGAFIIRNSWGSGWGENGYFYISYYDTNVGRENYIFDNADPVSDYSRVYQYDPLGWTGGLGYGSNTAWFSNVFSAVASEQLSAVSFYTASSNSSYEIYVFNTVTSGPTSGLLAGSKTGTLSLPGYHTVDLSSPILLKAGQKFSVVVKLTTPGYNYPISMERPYTGYSSQAKANAGESYISSSGSSWSDVTSSYPNTNVCLKAFTIPRKLQIVDFDQDGKTDPAVYRSSNGTWLIDPSGGAPYAVGWGGDSHDQPVPGDYDGDGKTDVAVYRSSTGVWWIVPSSGVQAYGIGWGGPAYAPVHGDYDGDGKTDLAVYNSNTGGWWVVPSSGTPAYGVGWGGTAFTPVPGDYDGDGKTDIAVYNTNTSAWWVIPSSGAPAYGVGWGGPAFKPVPGDYDGDGKTDVAVYQTGTGAWWINPSSGIPTYGVGWGGDPNDIPVPGDYDGDGKTDIAIYDSSTGTWWIIPSSGAPAYGVNLGGPGYLPVTE